MIKVKGTAELLRDLRKADRDLARELQAAIKDLARIVADDARSRAERFGGRTARGIKPAVRGSTGLVRQSIGGRRVRPQFGTVLMRSSFLPALAANETKVERELERMLDHLFSGAGL